MKRFIFIALMLILPLGMLAEVPGGKVSKRKVASIISQYKNSKGVEVIDLGWLGTSLIKGVMRFADDGDKDMKQALSMMKGLKGISILSYEDADKALKQKISSKLSNILKEAELLMEAKDEGDVMKIYGTLNEKTGKVSDVALFAPSDGTFIYLSGSFSMDDLAKVINEQ